jgi:hypothetical protein
MFDDRPDSAATADTLNTMKFFIPGVNTWYGASSLLGFGSVSLVWLESRTLSTSVIEVFRVSRWSREPKCPEERP